MAQILEHLLTDPGCLRPALDVKAICFHAVSSHGAGITTSSDRTCLSPPLRPFQLSPQEGPFCPTSVCWPRWVEVGTHCFSYQTALDVNEAHSIGVNFRPFCTGGVFVPHVARPRWNASPGSHARRSCSLLPDMQSSCRFASSASAALSAEILLASTSLRFSTRLRLSKGFGLSIRFGFSTQTDLAPKRIEHPNGLSAQTD